MTSIPTNGVLDSYSQMYSDSMAEHLARLPGADDKAQARALEKVALQSLAPQQQNLDHEIAWFAQQFVSLQSPGLPPTPQMIAIVASRVNDYLQWVCPNSNEMTLGAVATDYASKALPRAMQMAALSVDRVPHQSFDSLVPRSGSPPLPERSSRLTSSREQSSSQSSGPDHRAMQQISDFDNVFGTPSTSKSEEPSVVIKLTAKEAATELKGFKSKGQVINAASGFKTGGDHEAAARFVESWNLLNPKDPISWQAVGYRSDGDVRERIGADLARQSMESAPTTPRTFQVGSETWPLLSERGGLHLVYSSLDGASVARVPRESSNLGMTLLNEVRAHQAIGRTIANTELNGTIRLPRILNTEAVGKGQATCLQVERIARNVDTNEWARFGRAELTRSAMAAPNPAIDGPMRTLSAIRTCLTTFIMGGLERQDSALPDFRRDNVMIDARGGLVLVDFDQPAMFENEAQFFAYVADSINGFAGENAAVREWLMAMLDDTTRGKILTAMRDPNRHFS